MGGRRRYMPCVMAGRASFFSKQSAAENVRRFAALGGLLAPGSDAGAWAVLHGSLSEYQLLRDVLGENAEDVLKKGADKIKAVF